MPHGSPALKEEWVAGLAGLRETAEMLRECKGGELRRGQQEPLRCARECSRTYRKQFLKGKMIVYRRSTSRKVLGVMPMCRVNTAVKWLCVNPTVLATSPIGKPGSCNKVRA